MATRAMPPGKKHDHESGYYEGSDRESSMEYLSPSPASSRLSSHSGNLKRRHCHKRPPPKKPVNGFCVPATKIVKDKSVEVVECENVPVEPVADMPDMSDISPLGDERAKLSSSVELVGGTIPAPARDSIDWSLVEASRIRRISKCKYIFTLEPRKFIVKY